MKGEIERNERSRMGNNLRGEKKGSKRGDWGWKEEEDYWEWRIGRAGKGKKKG